MSKHRFTRKKGEVILCNYPAAKDEFLADDVNGVKTFSWKRTSIMQNLRTQEGNRDSSPGQAAILVPLLALLH